MAQEPEKQNGLENALNGEFAFSIVRSIGDNQVLTEKAYSDLILAKGFFNERLFGGRLSDCILSFGRLSHVRGYFCPDRFENTDGDLAHAPGKMTGYRVTHKVIEGGQFDLDCSELLASGFRINWHDRPSMPQLSDEPEADDGSAPTKPKKKKDRIKFTCPECTLNAWAKPSAQLVCGPCGLTLVTKS